MKYCTNVVYCTVKSYDAWYKPWYTSSQGFSSNLLYFCEQKSDLLVNLSESLMSLFKKERMSEERREWFALKHNKGKNCQKHRKNTNFLIDRFARITTESFTSLFLKSESLTVALKNERFLGKERISERVNSQPCLVLFSKTNSLSRTICLLLSGLCQL